MNPPMVLSDIVAYIIVDHSHNTRTNAHHLFYLGRTTVVSYLTTPIFLLSTIKAIYKMLSLGQTLASAAGLRPRKKFHFEVVFNLQDLLNCTYVSGVLFAKIRLKEGGHFSHASQR